VAELTDPVTLPRAEYDHLVLDAAAWRLLNESPHVAELLGEWVAWAYRAEYRAISSAISGAADWRQVAYHPTYAVLEKRRNTYAEAPLTPEQIRRKADQSWARVEEWITRRTAA
jgi:hypothetical protein